MIWTTFDIRWTSSLCAQKSSAMIPSCPAAWRYIASTRPANACLAWLPETRSQDPQARSFAVLWRESRALLAHSLFMGYVLQVALIYALFFVFVSLTPYVMVKTLGMASDRFGLYYLFLASGFFIGNSPVVRFFA